jgi:hypothetical protein
MVRVSIGIGGGRVTSDENVGVLTHIDYTLQRTRRRAIHCNC